MLILASASPRRHELLLAAGIAHRVIAANVPERRFPNELPRDYARRLAREKASAIAAEPGDIVLGADTIVVQGQEIFEKPANLKDAARMLQELSGRDHWVYTGICLRQGVRELVDIAATRVTFAALTGEEIEEYTRSGESLDKAGSYAIQGLASKFVTGIEGCYANVVGLPVSMVYRHLKAL